MVKIPIPFPCCDADRYIGFQARCKICVGTRLVRTTPAQNTPPRYACQARKRREVPYHTSPGAYKSFARPISFLLGFVTRLLPPSR